MQKPKLVIFDCDEILLDHLRALGEFVEKKYNITPTSKYPTEYGLVKWLGCSQEEVQEILRVFNEESYEFGLLKALDPYAPGLIKAIPYGIPGIKMAVLTKSGTKGHGEVLRRVNIENVYPGQFDEVHIIEMNESKSKVLSELQQRYDVVCLVDDYIQNIEDAIELGIPGIMLSRPHNQEYKDRTDFMYVESWGAIIGGIIDLHGRGE